MLEMLAIYVIFNLLWIFFQSSMQHAGVKHLSGKFGRMVDKVDDPAYSTKKVCAFMRVNACHFPEFSCYQCESESEAAQLCPTLCDPMDSSLSGSSVHGIFQARVLEWIAISFSRGSS